MKKDKLPSVKHLPIRFTNKPCPFCKEGGTETGYEVKIDCPLCLGSGRLPVNVIVDDLKKKDAS